MVTQTWRARPFGWLALFTRICVSISVSFVISSTFSHPSFPSSFCCCLAPYPPSLDVLFILPYCSHFFFFQFTAALSLSLSLSPPLILLMSVFLSYPCCCYCSLFLCFAASSCEFILHCYSLSVSS